MNVHIATVVMQLWLLSCATDTYGSEMEAHGLHAEWLNEFMATVRESVRRAPAWHNEPDRIQRYIHDIEFHVEQMVAHAMKANRAQAEEVGRQLAALLRSGEGKGYLSRQDVESLIQLMNKYLPVV